MELYWRTKRQRDERIAAEQRAAQQERRAAQQAAAEAQAAEQRRLAHEANVRELQRAAERAERDAPGGADMLAQSNVMAEAAVHGYAVPFEAGWNIAPTAASRGTGAADLDEVEEAQYNACSAALSEALPDD